MREATNDPSSLHPPQNQQFDSESNLLEQVDTYVEEDIDVLEEVDHYQIKESEQLEEENSSPHQSSIDAGTSTNGTHFVYTNWVSCISIKRLKYLTTQFHLPTAILKPGPNDRPHTPPPSMTAFF